MAESLELSLDTEGGHAWLTFRYPAATSTTPSQLIGGSVEVESGPLRLAYQFRCFGYDLDDFAEQLHVLHATARGEARFLNQEGSVFVAFGPGSRGRFTVCVELKQWGADTIRLCGHLVEQSYLPGMAEAVWRFLTTGADRTHPMQRGT